MRAHSFEADEVAKFWQRNRAVYQGASMARQLLTLSRHLLSGRILDAGAGDGSLVRAIRESVPGVSVAGVDLAPKSAEVEQGDLTALGFGDGSFDVVFCSEVIEHTPSDVTGTILTELKRVLRPGGHLVLTTPFEEVLEDSIVHCPGCDLAFHRWGHLQSFVEADFRRLAADIGLEVLHVLPFRMNRLRRYRFLGTRLLLSGVGRALLRGRSSSSNRTLLMIARKPVR